jgi:hypothetical protein
MYYTAPLPPLGTSSNDEEEEYWEKRRVEMMSKLSIRRGIQQEYLGKNQVPLGDGVKEAYIFQAGNHIIAIDITIGILLNVGSIEDNVITWHYSTIAENGTIETHVKAMIDHCGQILKPDMYKITCELWRS